jgi:multicomponent Na+:H+ antiporter subunit D
LVLTILEYFLAILFFGDFIYAARQKDFHQAVAFLSVAQLGYLFVGFLLGNKSALTGTLIELISQVLVVAGLFFIASTLRPTSGAQPFSRLAGLARHRPLTGLALIIFTASIVGVPPTGGSFGKWYLIQGALERKDWVLLAAVVATILFNLVYFTRLMVFLYEHRSPSLSLAPPSLVSKAPMLLLAAGVLLLGIFHQDIIHNFIEPTLPKAFLNSPLPNVPFLGKQVE